MADVARECSVPMPIIALLHCSNMSALMGATMMFSSSFLPLFPDPPKLCTIGMRVWNRCPSMELLKQAYSPANVLSESYFRLHRDSSKSGCRREP